MFWEREQSQSIGAGCGCCCGIGVVARAERRRRGGFDGWGRHVVVGGAVMTMPRIAWRVVPVERWVVAGRGEGLVRREILDLGGRRCR